MSLLKKRSKARELDDKISREKKDFHRHTEKAPGTICESLTQRNRRFSAQKFIVMEKKKQCTEKRARIVMMRS